jgi:hypothetical protein
MVQYSLPPCTNLFAFETENIIYSLTKRANLIRRSTVLSLPLQLVFPALILEPVTQTLFRFPLLLLKAHLHGRLRSAFSRRSH